MPSSNSSCKVVIGRLGRPSRLSAWASCWLVCGCTRATRARRAASCCETPAAATVVDFGFSVRLHVCAHRGGGYFLVQLGETRRAVDGLYDGVVRETTRQP